MAMSQIRRIKTAVGLVTHPQQTHNLHHLTTLNGFPSEECEMFVSDTWLTLQHVAGEKIAIFNLSDRGGNDICGRGDGDLTDCNEVMSHLSRARLNPP